MTRLSYQAEIYNNLSQWNAPFYFSKPVINHMVHFIDGALSVGFTGKLTEIHAYSHHKKHRTAISHFLKNGAWKEEYLLNMMKQHTMSQVKKEEPLFLLLDDTICQKVKPSLQAKHPTESTAFHFSHTVGKTVWSHQVLQLMIKSGEKAFPYEFELYHKEKTPSKIQLSIDMIQQFPTITQPTYLLCDTWFTSKKLIQASLAKGIHVISGLKTNRMIYPKGVKIQAKEFSTYIEKGDTNFVTVGTESYRVYRYEGAINDIEHAVVLMCWKAESPLEPVYMRCFLSTDTELSNEEILSHYSQRWSIETYFKQMKTYLGFNGYQVRSERAIKRFWLLVQFTYLFAMELKKTSFNEAIREVRASKTASIIEFVHHQATMGVPLEIVKNELNVA
jgi:hypothetical protein